MAQDVVEQWTHLYTSIIFWVPQNARKFRISRAAPLHVVSGPISTNEKENCWLRRVNNWNTKYQRDSISSFLSHFYLVLSQSHVATDGQSVSTSWCRAPSGAHDQILITLWQLLSCFMGRPLWQEDGSVFCICYWSLPAQSFLGPSSFGLATIFYCLRFETSLFVAYYDSQGHSGGIRSRLHTGIISFKSGC
jgi:hypothetical protein